MRLQPHGRRQRNAHAIDRLEPRVLLAVDRPFGSTWQDTTEFMSGNVDVTVVLLESSGEIGGESENWSSARVSRVESEIAAGLQWWEDFYQSKGYVGGLNFSATFKTVVTPYEPIRQKALDYPVSAT